jgi:membrane-associated phospholipid phosphatase
MSGSPMTEDVSNSRALIFPLALSALMVLFGATTASLARLDIRPLVAPYFSTAGAVTLLTLLVVIFIEIAKLARVRAPRPVQTIVGMLRTRVLLLLLPALLLPAFLVGFTAAKSSIPVLVGYTWDSFWANADLFIFGDDPWRITHRVFGSESLWIWQWFYVVGWGGSQFVVATIVPLYASRKLIGTFFTAAFATWLIGGGILAYSFSAAGPVFANLFDPTLTWRFAPLRELLASTLGNGPIAMTQHYLAGAVHGHVAIEGGGVSAMPSIHVAGVAIYVFASRRTIWFYPCILFWLIIFIASAYFGYHYWVDGIVGTIIAWLCWAASSKLYAGMTHDTLTARLQVA